MDGVFKIQQPREIIAREIPSSIPRLNSVADLNNNSKSFDDLIRESLAEVNRLQKKSDESVSNFVTGKTEDLSQVMIDVEKADIALRLMVQMRNKALEAYNEIMRLQI